MYELSLIKIHVALEIYEQRSEALSIKISMK
jgi:hypothetical protein